MHIHDKPDDRQRLYIYIIITKRKLRWHRRRLAERARLESEISVRRPSSSLRTKRTAPRGRVSEAGIVVLCKTFTHYIKTIAIWISESR